MNKYKYTIYPVNANTDFDTIILKSLLCTDGYDYSGNVILCFTRRRVRYLEQIFIKNKLADNTTVVPPVIATVHDYSVRHSSSKILPDLEAKYMLIQTLQLLEHAKYKAKIPEMADEILSYYQYLLQRYPARSIENSLDMLMQKLAESQSVVFLSDIVKNRLELLVKIIKAFCTTLNNENLTTSFASLHKISIDEQIGLLVVDPALIMYPIDYYLLDSVIAKTERGLFFVMSDYQGYAGVDTFISQLPHLLQENSQIHRAETDDANNPNVVRSATTVFLTAKRDKAELVSQMATKEDELRFIAKKIHELVSKGISADSISIVFPDPYKYIPAIKRIFSNYAIDYNYAFGERILNEAPVQAAFSVLKLVEEDFPRDMLLFMLRSKYFPIPDVKQIISAIKESTVIYGADYWKQAGGKVWELVYSILEIKQCTTPGKYLSAYMEALKALNYGRSAELNDRERTVIEDFWDLLRSLESLSSDLVITFSAFKRIVAYLLTQKRYFGLEKLPRGVNIMGVLETMHIHPEVIFFAGLVDGDEPKVKEWLMLPDRFHKQAGLPTVDELITEQKIYFDYVMNCGTKLIYLSYPQLESDSKNLCSMFLRDYIDHNAWQVVDLNDEAVYSHEEHLINRGEREEIKLNNYYEITRINNESIKYLHARYAPENEMSVSSILCYYDCPRAFFFQYVLRLEEIQEPSFDFDAKAWGTMIHEILCEAFKSETGWQKIAFDEFNKKINDLPNPIRLFYSKRFQLDMAFMEYFQKKFMSQYKTKNTELYVKESIGEPPLTQRLRGIIDRVDISEEDGSSAIIDYKTGSIDGPKYQLQLVLYSLLYYKCFGELPSKMLLVSLVGVQSKTKNILNRKKINEVIEEVMETTTTIISNIRNGVFFTETEDHKIAPVDAQNCRNCSFSCLC